MKTIANSNHTPTDFDTHTLEVVEGYYAPETYGVGPPGKLKEEKLWEVSFQKERTRQKRLKYQTIQIFKKCLMEQERERFLQQWLL